LSISTPVTVPRVWRIASDVGRFGGVERFEQFLIKRVRISEINVIVTHNTTPNNI
jgi:hypothetical protein